MTIPIDVNKLTVEQYIKFELAKLEPEPTFAIIRALLDITQEHIDEIPFDKLDKLILRVEFLRSTKLKSRRNKHIWIGWKRFKAFSSLNANQFTAMDTFKYPEQLADICSVCYGLKGKIGEHSELFKTQKIGKVSGQVFFCMNESENLKENLRLYSAMAKIEILNHMKEVSQTLEVSDEIMDGIMSSIN